MILPTFAAGVALAVFFAEAEGFAVAFFGAAAVDSFFVVVFFAAFVGLTAAAVFFARTFVRAVPADFAGFLAVVALGAAFYERRREFKFCDQR